MIFHVNSFGNNLTNFAIFGENVDKKAGNSERNERQTRNT